MNLQDMTRLTSQKSYTPFQTLPASSTHSVGPSPTMPVDTIHGDACPMGDTWPVKNRFSNPTKEQGGQDRQGKDITNDHQGKALREGCCKKREWARMSVTSREKNNT